MAEPHFLFHRFDFSEFSGVLSFIANECRPLIMFLFGFQSLVSSTASFIEMKTVHLSDAPHSYLSLDEYNQCVQGDIAAAMNSLDFTYHGKCVTIDPNYYGYIVQSMRCLVVLFLFDLIIHIMRTKIQHGWRMSYCKGSYIQWVYQFRDRGWYKTVATIFVVFATITILSVLYVGCLSPFWFSFLTSQIAPVVLTIVGAYHFLKYDDPPFATHTEQFRRLRFKRGWLQLVNQSSGELAQQISQAVYYAQYDDRSQLDAIIDVEGMQSDDPDQNWDYDSIIGVLDPIKKKEKPPEDEASKGVQAREPDADTEYRYQLMMS